MVQIIISEEDYALLQEVKKHGFYLKDINSELYTNSSKPIEAIKALKEKGIDKIVKDYEDATSEYLREASRFHYATSTSHFGILENKVEGLTKQLAKEKSLNKLLENRIENLRHKIEVHKKPWYKRLLGIN